MTTLAVFADIHGNIPALQAVLDDIDRLAPDEVLVGGDLVGRGPQGSRVIAAVRERFPLVIGLLLRVGDRLRYLTKCQSDISTCHSNGRR